MYNQCDNYYADEKVPLWKQNTHAKLISNLFLIHYILNVFENKNG